jgi:hypothetical protein
MYTLRGIYLLPVKALFLLGYWQQVRFLFTRCLCCILYCTMLLRVLYSCVSSGFCFSIQYSCFTSNIQFTHTAESNKPIMNDYGVFNPELAC